ncbi:MAG: rod shape-determining protein [Opitutales bacterium]|nr:rod shape-determining protein [Opitutales bacterium]
MRVADSLAHLFIVFGLFSKDIGIDLGTANTLIYVKDKGIVVREPSVVAVDVFTRKVHQVGDEAKKMLGRTPGNLRAVRPLKDGVISDFEACEEMLRRFIRKVDSQFSIGGPRVVIAVPSGITKVERRAVEESAYNAGARSVVLLEEPFVAAIGAGLPIDEASANMIVDIGGGTTEIAIISLSGIVLKRSIRVGGDEMDDAIINFLKQKYTLNIGQRTAEEIKIRIGSAYKLDKELKMEVRGQDSVAGLPRMVNITSQEIRKALSGTLQEITTMIRKALEICPPELSSDLVDRGFFLAGGGALLRGLDTYLSEITGLPVLVAEDPLTAVASGAGIALENVELLLEYKKATENMI